MLTENMRRVYALNCVLNGHSLLCAYGHDTQKAAEGMELTPEEVVGLDVSLRKLEKDYADQWCTSKVTRTILNLFRTREYAFIQTPNGPIYLQELAESDRQGQIREDVREAVLASLVHDIQYVKAEKETRYFDGLLMIPHGITNSELKRCILDAYKLYRDGPGTGKEPVLKWRYQMNIASSPTLNAGSLVGILRRMLKDGYAPTSYTRSTIMIADWSVVYESTGCLCEQSASQPGYVNISAADPDTPTKTVCISLPAESLATVVRGGLRKMSSMTCEKTIKGKQTVYRLMYGGVPVNSGV